MLNSWHRVVYLIALIVFSAVFADAQSSTSRITGTVADVNGSIVEGAKVTVTK